MRGLQNPPIKLDADAAGPKSAPSLRCRSCGADAVGSYGGPCDLRSVPTLLMAHSGNELFGAALSAYDPAHLPLSLGSRSLARTALVAACDPLIQALVETFR